jgi:uncharacterized membrane protein
MDDAQQHITAEVDVEAPIEKCFDEWSDLERLPTLLSMVESVEMTGKDLSHWVVSVAGVRREFDARTTEFARDQAISWIATGEAVHSGTVRFSPAGPDRTRIEVELSWVPDSAVEKAGAALHLDERAVESDLRRFKRRIEGEGDGRADEGVDPLPLP